nr:hypothetical protein Iba_chr04eCG0770 [Ipomoea batatas]
MVYQLLQCKMAQLIAWAIFLQKQCFHIMLNLMWSLICQLEIISLFERFQIMAGLKVNAKAKLDGSLMVTLREGNTYLLVRLWVKFSKSLCSFMLCYNVCAVLQHFLQFHIRSVYYYLFLEPLFLFYFYSCI